MPRALFSASSKQGLVGFANELVRTRLGDRRQRRYGPDLDLMPAYLVTKVERVTGQGEMLGGRRQDLAPGDPRRHPGARYDG